MATRRTATTATQLLAAGALAIGAGCAQPPTPPEAHAAFCETLTSINTGAIDTSGLKELTGHAKVLGTLLDVSPSEIRDDMAQFHSAFEAWAEAVSGEKEMLETFGELTDPSLPSAQGRIGDYIAEHCGLRLGDGEYKSAPRPSAQDICPGWPRIGSPLTFNNFPNLPDISGANYFANEYFISSLGLSPGNSFSVERGGWVVLRGQYPRSRYFAYHPNDMDLNNLQTLRDVDLDPDSGSVNPFRAQPESGSRNYYTAKLVFDAPPENPEPNTSYVGLKKDGKTENRYVNNMLRLYASDIGDGANSGGVP
ncbi:MAG: hypothetical protein QF570_15565, partial [Myxococcota bacterium]|nr:hypothetical protein [Myxococcota bacterium]